MLGVFSDRGNAEEVISELEAQDYNPQDISFVMKDRVQAQDMSDDTGAGDVVGGAASGATTGAVVGGIGGFLAGTVLPGLAGFLIGGPIGAALGLTGVAATTVSGATTGAVAGGLIGALTEVFDLSDDEAQVYEQRINEGGILVAVPVRKGDEDEVRSVMEEYEADNIKLVDQRVDRLTKSRSHTYRSSNEEDYAQMGAKGGSTDNDDID